jgi:hypothetical protein
MSDMFEITNEAVANLVMLAKEGESMDPINWGNLKSLDRWRNYC